MILPVKFLLGDSSEEKNSYLDEVKPDFVLSKSEVVVVGYNPSASVKDDAYYATQPNSAIQEKNHKQEIKHIDELIRRNPFNEKLYCFKVKAQCELGQADDICNNLIKNINVLGKGSPK